VQDAFRRAAAGETLRAVHRWARALPSAARGDRVLTYRAVRQILGSPVYIARLPIGDDDVLARPLGRWEPLVDEATWLRVWERIASHQHVPRQASQRYLLTGLLRCPNCGNRMHGKARIGHARSYRCSSNNSGANTGTQSCLSSALAEHVDQAVLAEVLPLIETAVSAIPELREALERAWTALQQPATLQDELQERQRHQLEREMEQAKRRLTNAAVLFADGEIDKPGYELLRDKARADLEGANDALAQLQPVEPSVTLPPLESVLAAAEGWEAAMRVLAALIERVVPMRIGWGQYAVEITWSALGDGLRAAATAPTGTTVRSAA
jgi:site-specific DNA recombinase